MLKKTYFKFIGYLGSSKNEFNLVTALIFILGCINIYYKINWTKNGFEAAFNLWNPTWLLFGPLLFCAYKAFTSKLTVGVRHLWHLVPFICFTCFFAAVYLSTNMDHPWQNTLFTTYQNSYAVIIVSLLAYSTVIILKIIRLNIPDQFAIESLIISIGAMYMLIALVMTMMYTAWGIVYVDLGIDYRFFSYALLLFVNVAIVWYWVFGRDRDSKSNAMHSITAHNENKSYKNSPLGEILAAEYKDRITTYFKAPEIYVDSKLSLDVLAKELNIPKHYLSQLFNIYLKKSFHQFVAEHRIDHAIDLLNANNGRLTIESLAYACGFNSKTSFNRYFKNRTGLTPSEFQLQIGHQSA